MPSTEEREAQPVMAEPCPKCGSAVVLRNWKGQFYAKCKRTGCPFEYDTDFRGNVASHCATCSTGRIRTTASGRVCADCGAGAPVQARVEPPKVEASLAAALGACPKCKKGKLAVRSGAYGTFVSCSERCGLSYSSDEEGVPEGGLCKACQGPVKKTQNGSRVCAVCGVWQEDKRPAAAASAKPSASPEKPKAASCPRCAAALRAVFTKRQTWVYRCDFCQAWYDA